MTIAPLHVHHLLAGNQGELLFGVILGVLILLALATARR